MIKEIKNFFYASNDFTVSYVVQEIATAGACSSILGARPRENPVYPSSRIMCRITCKADLNTSFIFPGSSTFIFPLLLLPLLAIVLVVYVRIILSVVVTCGLCIFPMGDDGILL
jgi:hypothetical protein